jgi:hypothetical protein
MTTSDHLGHLVGCTPHPQFGLLQSPGGGNPTIDVMKKKLKQCADMLDTFSLLTAPIQTQYHLVQHRVVQYKARIATLAHSVAGNSLQRTMCYDEKFLGNLKVRNGVTSLISDMYSVLLACSNRVHM